MLLKINLSWLMVWFTIGYIIQIHSTEEIDSTVKPLQRTFYGLTHLSQEFKKPVQLQEEIIGLYFTDANKQEANGTYHLITYYQKIPMPDKNDISPRFIIQKNPINGDWELKRIIEPMSHQDIIIDTSSNVNDRTNPVRNAIIVSIFCSLQKRAKEVTENLRKDIESLSTENEILSLKIKDLEEDKNKFIEKIQKLEQKLLEKEKDINKLEENISEKQNKISTLHSKFNDKFTQKLLKEKQIHAEEIQSLEKQHHTAKMKMTQENDFLKKQHLEEIEKMKNTFFLNKKKLEEFDQLQLQLNLSTSENEKHKYTQTILEEERKTLQDLNTKFKQENKKLSKECESKSNELVKKYKKNLASEKCSVKTNKEYEKNTKKVMFKINLPIRKETLSTKEKKEHEKVLISNLQKQQENQIPNFWKELNSLQDTCLLQEIKYILENINTIFSDSTRKYQSILLYLGGHHYASQQTKQLQVVLTGMKAAFDDLDDNNVQFFFDVLQRVRLEYNVEIDHQMMSFDNMELKHRVINIIKNNDIVERKDYTYEKSIISLGVLVCGAAKVLQEFQNHDRQEETLGMEPNDYLNKFAATLLANFPTKK